MGAFAFIALTKLNLYINYQRIVEVGFVRTTPKNLVWCLQKNWKFCNHEFFCFRNYVRTWDMLIICVNTNVNQWK